MDPCRDLVPNHPWSVHVQTRRAHWRRVLLLLVQQLSMHLWRSILFILGQDHRRNCSRRDRSEAAAHAVRHVWTPPFGLVQRGAALVLPDVSVAQFDA